MRGRQYSLFSKGPGEAVGREGWPGAKERSDEASTEKRYEPQCFEPSLLGRCWSFVTDGIDAVINQLVATGKSVAMRAVSFGSKDCSLRLSSARPNSRGRISTRE